MKDNQELMMQFSKIVERHPEIYDHNLESYYNKGRQVDSAWEKVADSVRMELKEECTVEELKVKWKGIRSSFSRYKSKLLNPTKSKSCKKYYLYDTLKFLDPFTKPKGPQTKDNLYEECVFDEESKTSNGNISSDGWSGPETKPDISNTQINPDPSDQIRLFKQRLSNTNKYENYCENAKKRKYSDEDKSLDDDGENLQFFKSILPDIRDFTNKEKRKLKIGILRLIDDIENERNQQKVCSETNISHITKQDFD